MGYAGNVRAANASLVCTALACLLASSTSWADVHDECIAAAEQSQPLRHEGKLREARERLRTCSKPQCPAIVRSDCTKWLADVDASTPTIVVHATDPTGADLTDVRVLVDGKLAATAIDGRDIPLDPGPHTIRFERDGSPPMEQRMVADVGAQHRLLSVTFPSTAPAPAAQLAPAAVKLDSGRTSPAGEQRSHRSVVLPLMLGVVGVAAAAVGGILWGHGLSQCRSNLAPSGSSCNQVQLDGAQESLVAGDVLVTVGAAIATAGLIVWIAQGSSTPSPVVTAMSDGVLRF